MHNKDQVFQFNIYLCWLLAWAGTLKHQDRKEHIFLVLQAIEVLKKLVYKCEPNLPIDIFKVLLYSSFENGDERMIKKFESCVDEFKLPPNITIQIMTLNSQGRGER